MISGTAESSPSLKIPPLFKPLPMPTSLLPRATPLDVSLLNGRSYVQGTQMIARACAQLVPAQAKLSSAKFLRLTDRQIHAALAANASVSAPEELVGVLQLDAASNDRTVLLLEGSEPAPPCQSEVQLRLLDLQHDGRLSGHYAFESADGLVGLLDALVQGIKRLHEGLQQPVCDIWFTGLRQIELPLHGLPTAGRGRVDVTQLRVLSRGRQHQSLLRVQLVLEGLERPLDGQVSFAFRDTEGGHVN